MYKRTSFKIYTYEVIIDEVVNVVKRNTMIDYKASARNLRNKGAKTVKFNLINVDYWEE